MNLLNNLSNKKYLVLGADGYIARHLVKYIGNYGGTVISYVHHTTGLNLSAYDKLIDVAKNEGLDRIDWNVDAVFIMTGLTGTYESLIQAERFVEANEIGLINILDNIRLSPYRPRVVFPSTRLVYRGSSNPIKEDGPCEPKTIYAVNKLACEQILKVYSYSFNISYTIYRICVLYGNSFGNNYSFGTIGNFIKQAKSKEGLIKIYGDGLLRRTFTHIEDLCLQITSTCDSTYSCNQIFNTCGETKTLVEVSNLIAEKYNARVEFLPFPKKDLIIESGHTVFDSAKLMSLFQINRINNLSNWIDEIKT